MTVWVDPVKGENEEPASRINDPDRPFKTLQEAIDAVSRELVNQAGGAGAPGGNPPSTLLTEGTVIALPGVYGPTTAGTPNASGDMLPIVMRDRVHVRGQGAARCFLRGDDSGNLNLFWPDGQFTYPLKEVLLDLSRCSVATPALGSQWPPPWFDPDQFEKDVAETFDGFTFQGGDVQVLMRSGRNTAATGAGSPWVSKAIVSNCVFDMRNGWTAQGSTISGPTFGVMLLNGFSECQEDEIGYLDTRLLVLHDTFVMAQDGPAGWVYSARDEAVGIINVNDVACNDASGQSDCDQTLRGLARPGIVNSVFRTLPGSNQMAMLGIDLADTQVLDQGTPVQTNAFAGARAGAQSPSFPTAGFSSTPMVTQVVTPYTNLACVFGDLLDCGSGNQGWFSFACMPPPPPPGGPCNTTHTCVPASLPTPQVEIYDGTAGVGADPAFVGEYLARSFASEFAPGYADWRLLPGAQNQPHPLQDRGYMPVTNTLTMANGTSFKLPDHPQAPAPFRWDGEGYGNPRVVDGSPDLGHDEIHLLTMTGSYSDNSTSHHTPGFLAPDLPVAGSERYVIVRRYTPTVDLAVGNLIQVNGTVETPLDPQTGWTQPPGTLVPATTKQGLPVDYQTKWIRYANAGLSTLPWDHVVQASSLVIDYEPLGAVNSLTQRHRFVLFTVTDDEGTDHDYFNTQGVVYDDGNETTDLLRSNLQVEYR